jgi:hypothetical protein
MLSLIKVLFLWEKGSKHHLLTVSRYQLYYPDQVSLHQFIYQRVTKL